MSFLFFLSCQDGPQVQAQVQMQRVLRVVVVSWKLGYGCSSFSQ